METPEVFGSDIGRVIIDGATNDGTDTSFFSGNFLQTSALPGAVDALASLVAHRFGMRVHLVSRCGDAVQAKTIAWLNHHGFFERTGVPRDHVHFCRRRHEKDGICREPGITHFVDDRLEVLGYLKTVSNLYLFQGDPREVERHAQHLRRVRRVASWNELLQELLSRVLYGLTPNCS